MAALCFFGAADRVSLVCFSYFWVRLWFLCIFGSHSLITSYRRILVHDSNLTCSKLWYGPALGLFVIAQDCI